MFDRKEYKREWYLKNKERLSKKARLYREKNREKIKEYMDEYSKQYREKNSEKLKGKQKRYYNNNKEKITIRKKQYYENNREHLLAKSNEWRKRNRKHISRKQIESTHNLTYKEWEGLWYAQDGRCAICDKYFTETKDICVDHDHKTNEIRGLLCNKCNFGIGHFNDNPELLKSAMEYLMSG